MTEDLRDAYARYYGGDVGAHLPLLTDDVVVVDRSGTPDAGAHVGKDAFVPWAQDLHDLSAEIRLEDLRIETIGERVLAVSVLDVLTPAAGMRIELQLAHVLTLRDGLIAQIDAFLGEDAARAFACE